ncbi:uncharacterized protein [Rutidosis leptorrhynchoides]|uniref:uncharacterized protein n=1 Tax=Rutidosis leptorrhynchoides TaxID=125765 RepID=UPI003A9A5FE9
MAASKLVICSLLICFLFASQISADASIGEPVVGSDGSESSSALKIELDQLNSKIQALESHVQEKIRDLKSKDEIIAQKEKIIQEKSSIVSSLESDLSSLQNKGKLDAAEKVGKAHARAGELEKQIDKLKKDIEEQDKEKKVLEARTTEAEKNISELNLKLEKLQKINEEQKSKIHKTERALKFAEEEMVKAKYEATSKHRELSEVHGAWLPPWLAVHVIRLQSVTQLYWNEHGKPAMNKVLEKVSEKKAQAGKWAEPHVETIKTKWVPAAIEQLEALRTQAEPHVQTVKAKSIEVYETSKTTLTPHVIKVQEVVDPYFQQAKELSKPYIDQVATMAKPHVEKVRVVLKPYTKEVVKAYGKFLESATLYHHQLQGIVRENLKKYELTKPLASKELEWFAASALLALPIIILFRILSATFCTKTKRPARHAHPHHHGGRRKAKRGHPDK